MAAVGIGGVFFRAENPDALTEWYRVHLGVGVEGQFHWDTEAGPMVFMPFKKTTDYWPEAKQWMINFRVSDLDGLIASLQAAGIDVKTDPAWNSPEVGRFARISDPEGNQVELWEPPAE
ncbi:MAG: VOC family protein [Hyphomicrobiaceae bacterium]|nr:VOC family protein [Hyphomicrobiaceae bacterium]